MSSYDPASPPIAAVLLPPHLEGQPALTTAICVRCVKDLASKAPLDPKARALQLRFREAGLLTF